ncbi:metal-dependent hydrolase [uncultured Methanobrevibacter sp.]|uniref:metal-dependent hydrolase n=1 Tax=uncultured Methanobrevibacter sp. TaxID=253161 RepID=UPI00262D3F18|nr:metal-dependent hydrolase [uncultured Methanobrevibacter sp.]
MSSYKGHTLFALILGIMFFNNPLIIALSIIGANIPDFDHKFKKDNVYRMIILGLIVFISLYILKLPYYLGLIIVFLGTVFYFSQHRSFTHSIFGVLTLTAAVSLILIWAYEILMNITVISTSYLFMAILIALLSFLFLNKKLILIFLPLFFISLFFFGTLTINYVEVAIGLFLGLLSHIVLDSFSPAGIKLFAPLSSKKYHKKFGIVVIVILFVLAIYLRRFEIIELMQCFFPNIY